MDHGHQEIVVAKSPRVSSTAGFLAILILLFLLLAAINFVKASGHQEEAHGTEAAAAGHEAAGEFGPEEVEGKGKVATHNDAFAAPSVLEYNSATMNAAAMAASSASAAPAKDSNTTVAAVMAPSTIDSSAAKAAPAPAATTPAKK